ncbi:helix-turn-helix domain-containing protein [Acidovorax sp. SUPP2522]|uniref:helix-turn-helix domain-containing protein n=2 Tax=unclassified Acidovorax TaxID=2684926 RepID=UPI00234BB96A|nr:MULTISPECIES: helix-turn-helix transcriptional regulator [unclassified Acidovorax]WCM96378.1 helix-turn-helix domain-containing protein [Acidovorax sp. GBBC 1281]GKT18340.1 helix-turn-helix domain-containing protein [Acidovorax sp. SUPP2522]
MSANLPRGRPLGSTTFDPVVASSFGKAVVEMRTAHGMSQLALAMEASIERAHMGRIERGERVPNLVAIVKIATALGCITTALVQQFERQLVAAGDNGK